MTMHPSPAATPMSFRIGDSGINVAARLTAFFALVVTIGRKYRRDFGVGSLALLMLPVPTALLACWTPFDLPPGPNTPTCLAPQAR
jgi:aminobenzoyl-glutamate transport protein